MMSEFIKSLRNMLDKTILIVCGVAIILLVITVTWQVFSRYVLNDPSSFTDELSRYTMIWLGLLGASYLFGKNKHLAITLLGDSISKRKNEILQFFINILVLFFVIFAMFKGGISLMARTMEQLSPALQLPMAYVYLILPVSAVVIVVYIMMNILEPILTKKNN
jgi:TRAP-type C4-dicarboxylate transport system permease small subunit